MSVTEEAQLGVLIGEARGRLQLLEHVTPSLGAIQGRMDDGEIGHQTEILEFPQPLAVVRRQLGTTPSHRLGRGVIEPLGVFIEADVFVMVALDRGDVHPAYDVETLLRVGAISDDIAQTHDMGTLLFLDVGKHPLETF